MSSNAGRNSVFVISAVVILDSSDFAALNDTVSWVGVVFTGAVAALDTIIVTNTDNNIFSILTPRLSDAFTNWDNIKKCK